MPAAKKIFLSLAYSIFTLSSVVAVIFCSGLYVMAVLESIPVRARSIQEACAIFCAAVILGGLAAIKLYKKDGPVFFANSMVMLAALLLGVYGLEALACYVIPSWPAIGLHGLDPVRAKPGWARVLERNGAVGMNSWGQRDSERSLLPACGVQRIVFVGDSFLEESPEVPLSVMTEQKLDNPRQEIINLGVSATGPDEYFYRMKNIAMPIGATHCFMFIYSGNDFIDVDFTLESMWGIAAVYPRDSVLSIAGLSAWNHLLINKRRPVLRCWGGAGWLASFEESLYKKIKNSSDDESRELLVSLVENRYQEQLRTILESRDLKLFFEMLRAPDNGSFRSYYIKDGLDFLVSPHREHSLLNSRQAFHWVKKASALCKQQAVHFTVVVIPEAFQVDTRMQQLWMPLADMKAAMQSRQAAARLFLGYLEAEHIDYIDLFGVLCGRKGTYLNPDGHWSTYGASVVADEIVRFLRNYPSGRLNPRASLRPPVCLKTVSCALPEGDRRPFRGFFIMDR